VGAGPASARRLGRGGLAVTVTFEQAKPDGTPKTRGELEAVFERAELDSHAPLSAGIAALALINTLITIRTTREDLSGVDPIAAPAG